MAKAFIVPFCLYLCGTAAISFWPDDFPLGYLAVVLSVGWITWLLFRGRNIVVPHARIGAGVAVGILGIAAWVGLSELRLEQHLAAHLPSWMRPQPRVGYNPHEHLSGSLAYWGFIAVRFVGLVIIVPIVEEVFWRGFLARWIKAPNWEQVPLGDFSAKSFLMVVLLFALAHPEWLAAACYCAMLNGLLIWKRDLWNCIVAHAVSNFLLGVYILKTEAWWLW
jgi:CAAX protease family protein